MYAEDTRYTRCVFKVLSAKALQMKPFGRGTAVFGDESSCSTDTVRCAEARAVPKRLSSVLRRLQPQGLPWSQNKEQF